MLPALAASPKAQLVAVASRSGQLAETFGAERMYASYDDLLADPEVDAVYVPLPNGLHAEWVCRAADAGKHVLCEKPLACSADEARRMVAAFEQRGLLLVEAYMTPFHPRSTRVRGRAALGAAGRAALRPHRLHRRRCPSRTTTAGGPSSAAASLLDLGVYCLAPLLVAAQRLPVEVVGLGHRRAHRRRDVVQRVARLRRRASGPAIECSYEARRVPGRRGGRHRGQRARAPGVHARSRRHDRAHPPARRLGRGRGVAGRRPVPRPGRPRQHRAAGRRRAALAGGPLDRAAGARRHAAGGGRAGAEVS